MLLHYEISGDGGAKAGDLHKRRLSGSYFEQQWVVESTDGPSSVSDLGGLLFVLPLDLQKWNKVLVYGERGTLSFVSNFRRRWWFCVSWAITVWEPRERSPNWPCASVPVYAKFAPINRCITSRGHSFHEARLWLGPSVRGSHDAFFEGRSWPRHHWVRPHGTTTVG